MANTFVTATKVARDASILLRDQLVLGNLVNRNVVEPMLDSNSGGSVKVSYTPVPTAEVQDHSSGPSALTGVDITESSVTVPAYHYVAVRKTLNTKEKTYQLDDFNNKVTLPAMVAIAEAVDKRLLNRLEVGFDANVSGTITNAATTAAHVLNARKVLFDNKCPMGNINGIIGSAEEVAFLQVAEFKSIDYGSGNNSAVQRAQLSERYGTNWYTTQNAAALSVGDTAGTTLVDGAGAVGDTTLTVDGFTAATGTVYAGTRFTVAGTATVYTVTDDTAIASNEATLPIEPALTAIEADNDAVTFEATRNRTFMFNPAGTAAAIVAPPPLMNNSSTSAFEGLSIRVSMESTTTNGSVGAADFILFDCYVGCEVIRPECGVLLHG